MGAWGIHNFENDGSHDWLIEFLQERSRETLEAPFQVAIDSAGDYLEVDECHAVLAAGEVIAASLGRRCSDFPETEYEQIDWGQIRSWVDASLLAAARKALDRVVSDRDDSEIYELWAEADDLSEWVGVVDDLRTRLESAT